MNTVPKKRDPNVGIIDGAMAFSDDLAERREGFLMLSEHLLVGFAESFGTLECEGFFSNEVAIKQKLQELYDEFMKEYDVYLKVTDNEGRFKLEPVEPGS